MAGIVGANGNVVGNAPDVILGVHPQVQFLDGTYTQGMSGISAYVLQCSITSRHTKRLIPAPHNLARHRGYQRSAVKDSKREGNCNT